MVPRSAVLKELFRLRHADNSDDKKDSCLMNELINSYNEQKGKQSKPIKETKTPSLPAMHFQWNVLRLKGYFAWTAKILAKMKYFSCQNNRHLNSHDSKDPSKYQQRKSTPVYIHSERFSPFGKLLVSSIQQASAGNVIFIDSRQVDFRFSQLSFQVS